MWKLMTTYANECDPELYHRVPKAVWAAIALTPWFNGGAASVTTIEGEPLTLEEYVVTEWYVQHRQGLIPQRVPGQYLKLVKE